MNDWNIKANKMVETSKGVYEISLLLKPGEYEYKFNEAGMFYVTDQNAKDFADDGFGGKNSVLVVDDSFDKVIIKNFEKPKGFIARKLSSSIQDPVDRLANIIEEKSMWQKFGL